MPAKIRMGTAQMRLCPPYAPFVRPREILDDAWLAGGGNRKPRCAFYPPGATSVECECVMKDELTTILDAMRAAQAETRRLSRVRRSQRRTDDRQARGHSRPSRGRQGHAVVARLGAPERRAADAAKNVGRGELTRFAAGLCETNFLSAMPHEKPRLEATLAGFDIRSPRAGRPRRCHVDKHGSQNLRRLPGLRLKPRENLVKSTVAIGTSHIQVSTLRRGVL